MGPIKCLPPCHVTNLASCQNTSCDLALCQVPAMWLGIWPMYVTSLGTMPTSLTASLSTSRVHFFQNFRECSFAAQNIPLAICFFRPPLRQRDLNSYTELYNNIFNTSRPSHIGLCLPIQSDFTREPAWMSCSKRDHMLHLFICHVLSQ